jgi:hypothetical protein
MKYIFKHYLRIERVFIKVDEHFTDANENSQVKVMIEEAMHHRLLDLVLDELEESKRSVLLEELENEFKHTDLILEIRQLVDNFEEKMLVRAKEAEQEFLSFFSK